ncbi:MAG: SAM-dependent methyltransferase [Mycobacterium sp.]|jgi:methyltransferase (TIGR00027 family)|nr:SAM-dependent methyltransferase [Mycobacterium sp.]
MARTDDDTWDITDGVGATALGVAMARAGEAASGCPLFTDPYAQLFLDAATARGWVAPYDEEMLGQLKQADPSMAQCIQAMSGYTASRTKYFDEFFVAAGAAGIQQAVILAAGLDARAWRLPWVSGTVVYEIDQPKVLQFKADTLRSHRVEASVGYVAVPLDLRQDWPKALREKGFDSSKPTAWSAEGLLPYLPGEGQDLLFARIQDLSAPDSRVAVEAFGPKFFDQEHVARRRALMQQVREVAAKAGKEELPDTEQLFFMEEHADVTDWLRDHHWDATAVEAQDLMTRYNRNVPTGLADASLETVFVEGRRTR